MLVDWLRGSYPVKYRHNGVKRRVSKEWFGRGKYIHKLSLSELSEVDFSGNISRVRETETVYFASNYDCVSISSGLIVPAKSVANQNGVAAGRNLDGNLFVAGVAKEFKSVMFPYNKGFAKVAHLACALGVWHTIKCSLVTSSSASPP